MAFERGFFGLVMLVMCLAVGFAIYAETTRTTPAYIERANGSRNHLQGRLMYRPGDWWKTGEPSTGFITYVWPADEQAVMHAKGELKVIPLAFGKERCLIGRHYTPYRYIVAYNDSSLKLYRGDKLVIERPCWPL